MSEFEVKTYNEGSIMRVTHVESGISRLSEDVSQDKVTELAYDIQDEIARKKQPLNFAMALNEVLTNGKGMKIPGDDSVIRAQYPDQYSISSFPYLYAETKYGRVPWTVDTFAPFATWVVVD